MHLQNPPSQTRKSVFPQLYEPLSFRRLDTCSVSLNSEGRLSGRRRTVQALEPLGAMCPVRLYVRRATGQRSPRGGNARCRVRWSRTPDGRGRGVLAEPPQRRPRERPEAACWRPAQPEPGHVGPRASALRRGRRADARVLRASGLGDRGPPAGVGEAPSPIS